MHKAQGMTLHKIVTSIDPSMFAAGSAYVALSRVPSLQQLYLLDFNVENILYSEKVGNLKKLSLSVHAGTVPDSNNLTPA